MTDSERANLSSEKLTLPVLPEQAPGLSFEVKASGLIGIADSGQATPNDHKQIEDIRDVLLDALDDVIELCKNSDAFAQAARIANKYKSTLNADPLSIDKLYAWGIRLENSNTSIAASIKAGDLPAKDFGVAEAFDSVLALHGTSVLLTQRGQELVAKGNAYRRTKEEQIAYREKALELIQKIRAKRVLVEPEAVDALEAADNDMAKGRHPERSSELAEAGNSNILGFLSQLAIGTSAAVVAKGLAATVPGQLAAEEVTQLANVAWFFLLENKILLSDFAQIGGQQLSYIQSVLNVISRFGKPEQFKQYVQGDRADASIDLSQNATEQEARRLIIAGNPVPHEIAKHVRHLDISDCKIDTLSNLANLANLEALNASNNQIRDLWPISKLKMLIDLSVSVNKISDLSPLAGLTRLEHFDAYINEISDLTPLARLSKLQSLQISSNLLDDLTPLKGLLELQSLGIDNNQIKDLSPLSSLSALHNLDVSTNQIFEITPVAYLSNLVNVGFYDNQISDISSLAGLIRLETLDASHNLISDLSPIASCVNLENLQIYNNEIVDLSPLKGFRQLETLDASNNQILDLSPVAGIESLKNLEVSNNRIVDLNPIASLVQLQQLRVSGNPIIVFAAVANIPKLRRLDLSSTKISDLTPLADMPELQYLNIAFLNVGSRGFSNWPTALKGVCIKGTTWLTDHPAISNITSIINTDGTISGEDDDSFRLFFFDYLPHGSRTLE
jgi:Leucine-rich repeat (LRR) protein